MSQSSDSDHVLTRRMALLVAGASCTVGTAFAQASPEARMRPQVGDHLVFASGVRAGQIISPSDLVENAPQVLSWAADPVTGTVRDGSRLNEILLVRLDESTFGPLTRQHTVAGVVAYSATCSHAQCPVTEWRVDELLLHCPCHNSEYDPRNEGKVVNGPASRALAALPLGTLQGKLIVAHPFIGKVGAPTPS